MTVCRYPLAVVVFFFWGGEQVVQEYSLPFCAREQLTSAALALIPGTTSSSGTPPILHEHRCFMMDHTSMFSCIMFWHCILNDINLLKKTESKCVYSVYKHIFILEAAVSDMILEAFLFPESLPP